MPSASANPDSMLALPGMRDAVGWRAWCGAWQRGGRGGWGGAALVLLCLAVYLPGLWVIPPVDRDEARFAQASRQMVESGDWVVPRVQDKPRLNKPPLIYWLQSLSVKAFGDPPAPADPAERYLGNIWVFRLPSVLCAIGAALMTWRIGLSMFGDRPDGPTSAWLGAAFLAVCPLVAWDAHQARADQLLLLVTTAAMGAMWVVWRRNREGSTRDQALLRSYLRAFAPSCVFWLCLAVGILTKGPITPMVAGLTALVLCITTRRWRWLLNLRPLLGIVIALALVAPWLYLVGERVGWQTYLRTVYDETIGRSAGAKEGHWGPPGYHLVLSVVLLWPGSLLTALGVRHAWRAAFGEEGGAGVRRLRSAQPSPELFLLAWAIPSWIVFEVISTKLPHYPMPLYPALAILSARAVIAADAGALVGLGDRLTHIGLWIWRILAMVLCLPTFVFVWRSIARRRWVSASLWAMLGWVMVCIVVVQLVMPDQTDGSVRIEQARRALDPTMRRPFASIGYHEDSLVFLTRGSLLKINATDLPAWSASLPREGGLVLIDSAIDSSEAQSIRDAGLAEVGGASALEVFNYSTGKRLRLVWLERKSDTVTEELAKP